MAAAMIAMGRRPILTDEQREIVLRIQSFAERPRVCVKVPGQFTMGGLAGCGKTVTLAAAVPALEEMGLSVAVCAPTGKAALALRNKGLRSATTIHKLLFKSTPVEAFDPKYGRYIARYETVPIQKGGLGYDVLIVDESSMVSKDTYDRLMLHNIPTVFCGDFGQLPPYEKDKEKKIDLLSDRDATLQTIHRQAAGSAILRAAHKVRAGGQLDSTDAFPDQVSVENRRDVTDLLDDVAMVIVVRNDTRRQFNALRRQAAGFEGRLQAGEPIVCLDNAHQYGMLNGQTFRVVAIDDTGDDICIAQLIDELGETYVVPLWMAGFEAMVDRPKGMRVFDAVRVDFAHSLTCHKSQGSEWNSVAVVDEGFSDAAKWRYTATTRAISRLRYIRT